MSRKKRHPKPSSQELEAEADKILANDHLDLVELVKANTKLIEGIYEHLRQPNNSPAYLEALEAKNRQRQQIANAVVKIHVIPDFRGTYIGIEPRDLANHGQVLETARQLGEHFEAEIQRHDPPHKT